ncbi:hypothetical protein UA75_14270 [Actinoalloteichus sp. GBA129-24]|nr:hypothetical protein UA75_14270 [Actinoalloteichus sp. GBA129-24]
MSRPPGPWSCGAGLGSGLRCPGTPPVAKSVITTTLGRIRSEWWSSRRALPTVTKQDPARHRTTADVLAITLTEGDHTWSTGDRYCTAWAARSPPRSLLGCWRQRQTPAAPRPGTAPPRAREPRRPPERSASTGRRWSRATTSAGPTTTPTFRCRSATAGSPSAPTSPGSRPSRRSPPWPTGAGTPTPCRPESRSRTIAAPSGTPTAGTSTTGPATRTSPNCTTGYGRTRTASTSAASA